MHYRESIMNATILISALVSAVVAVLVAWWFVRYERRLTIKTEQYILTDSGGKTRVSLGMTDGLPGLRFFDRHGKRRAGWTIQDDGSSTARFYDPEEKPTGIIRVIAEGPSLALEDAQGRPKVDLAVGPDRSPGVLLSDHSGKPRVVVAVPEGFPSLTFLDQRGEEVFNVSSGVHCRLSAVPASAGERRCVSPHRHRCTDL